MHAHMNVCTCMSVVANNLHPQTLSDPLYPYCLVEPSEPLREREGGGVGGGERERCGTKDRKRERDEKERG